VRRGAGGRLSQSGPSQVSWGAAGRDRVRRDNQILVSHAIWSTSHVHWTNQRACLTQSGPHGAAALFAVSSNRSLVRSSARLTRCSASERADSVVSDIRTCSAAISSADTRGATASTPGRDARVGRPLGHSTAGHRPRRRPARGGHRRANFQPGHRTSGGRRGGGHAELSTQPPRAVVIRSDTGCAHRLICGRSVPRATESRPAAPGLPACRSRSSRWPPAGRAGCGPGRSRRCGRPRCPR
jgi:hypothetical protein